MTSNIFYQDYYELLRYRVICNKHSVENIQNLLQSCPRQPVSVYSLFGRQIEVFGPFKLCQAGHIFLQSLYGRGEIAFIIEERKRDAGWRANDAEPTGVVRGRPINPQQSHVLPSLQSYLSCPCSEHSQGTLEIPNY